MNSSAETVITFCCCRGSPVVFPGKGDLAIFQRQQAAIGNGHAMGVAAEILQHVLRVRQRGPWRTPPSFVVSSGARKRAKAAGSRSGSRSPKNCSLPSA